MGAPWGPRAPYGAELPPQDATWAPWVPYGAELLPRGATWAPLGPLWARIASRRRHMGPLGPLWAGISPKRLHMGPLGPLWGAFPSPIATVCGLSRKGVQKLSFFAFVVPKMVPKKLRLRGWDLSGEIRAEILCIFPPQIQKTVVWRPDW